MNYRTGIKLFYLIVAIFLVAGSFFLLREAGSKPATGLPASQEAPPDNLPVTETSAVKELIFYPRSPAPGDFIIVEAGPLDKDVNAELVIDFPGNISRYYHLGGILYAVVAISYNTTPGSYNLEVYIDNGEAESSTLSAEFTITDKEFRTSQFTMPPSRTEGWTAERLAEDREKVRLARENTEPYPLWLERFIIPLEGRVTSEYGAVRIINQNPPRRHAGIDIATDEGEPIIAPNRGIVRLAEFLLSGGYTVIIDHGLDLSSTYMHLHTLSVEEGDLVERGDKIGTVGMTGYATGPHLHWEVNIGQTPVNPEQLMANELLWIPPAYAAEIIKRGE